MYHWIIYIAVYFCMEDPQECSTASISLQLHQSRRCGPSDSTGYCSRSFVGCTPPWQRTSTNSLESQRVHRGEQRRHRHGCVPKHGNVFDSAGKNIVTTYLNCHLFQRTKLFTVFHWMDEVGSSQLHDALPVTQEPSPRPRWHHTGWLICLWTYLVTRYELVSRWWIVKLCRLLIMNLCYEFVNLCCEVVNLWTCVVKLWIFEFVLLLCYCDAIACNLNWIVCFR
jgi:hypothetical protein